MPMSTILPRVPPPMPCLGVAAKIDGGATGSAASSTSSDRVDTPTAACGTAVLAAATAAVPGPEGDSGATGGSFAAAGVLLAGVGLQAGLEYVLVKIVDAASSAGDVACCAAAGDPKPSMPSAPPPLLLSALRVRCAPGTSSPDAGSAAAPALQRGDFQEGLSDGFWVEGLVECAI